MTDPGSILQLGIEAARDGNKEEARDLFRLLTHEDADNVQGWLWLAGVAESREERQAALERVLELEPQNAMALKSLQAMGVSAPSPVRAASPESPTMPAGAVPSSRFSPERPPEPEPVPERSPEPEPMRGPPAAAPEGPADAGFEDDPFAELDSLSDVFSADPRAVGREAEPAATPAAESGQSEKERRNIPKSSWISQGKEEKKEREKPMAEGSRRSLVPALALLLAVVVVVLLVWKFVWPMFFGEEVAVGPSPTAPQGAMATEVPPPSPPPEQPGETPGEVPPDATMPPEGGATPSGEEPLPPGETPVPPEGETPPPPPEGETTPPGEAPPPATEAPGGPTAPPVSVATATPETPRVVPSENGAAPSPEVPVAVEANPTIVPPNTPQESNGWLYDFQQQTFALPIPGNIGNFAPQRGRFVHVLLMVANRTGEQQPLPTDFVVLKDAQGRVYPTLPEVSSAFVIRGVNADRGQEDPIPAGGLTTSVALFFDVALDATDLTLFAPSNPASGWRVLERVQ